MNAPQGRLGRVKDLGQLLVGLYVGIAGVAVVAFILAGGMRSAAFGAVVKDVLLW